MSITAADFEAGMALHLEAMQREEAETVKTGQAGVDRKQLAEEEAADLPTKVALAESNENADTPDDHVQYLANAARILRGWHDALQRQGMTFNVVPLHPHTDSDGTPTPFGPLHELPSATQPTIDDDPEENGDEESVELTGSARCHACVAKDVPCRVDMAAITKWRELVAVGLVFTRPPTRIGCQLCRQEKTWCFIPYSPQIRAPKLPGKEVMPLLDEISREIKERVAHQKRSADALERIADCLEATR